MQKKFIRIALRLPTRTSVTGKFKELKIGTVFEYHVYHDFPLARYEMVSKIFALELKRDKQGIEV